MKCYCSLCATLPQGQPQALSNFVRDEGGAASAAGAAEGGAAAGSEGGGGASRWLWRGPSPPSLWYALEMSGREVGASMEVRLSVNSSAPLTAVPQGAGGVAGGSPTAWRMGPDSSPAVGGGRESAGSGGEEGREVASPPLPPAYPSLAVEDVSSMNLSVAMRVGALPVIDPNGEASERAGG